MNNLFKWLLAVVFPWVVILMDDNPGGAILALILQVTIIGWIPASMWAMRVMREKSNSDKKKKA